MGQLIEVGPDEAAGWLEAGLTLPELSRLRGLPLDRVLQWRAARFEAAETERLLRADPTLTPAEARAFAEAGIADDDRLQWAEAGFSAADASAWSGLDILPQEARVWRSVSKGPDDAREHRLAGGGPLPSDVRVGWTAHGSGQRQFRRYGVTDPPGTRGRIAAEREPRVWRGRRA